MTCTCVNPTFFASLPEDIQQIVLETIDEMYPRSFEIQKELNDAALDKILDAKPDINVEELTDDERAAYAELAQNAYAVYGTTVGADGQAILDKLLEEIADIEAK